MITRSMLIIAIAGATAISFLPTFTSSVYSIHHHGPYFSPFLPVPFSPPCVPTNMLLDSVSVLSTEYACSVPNTLHPNVALSTNLISARQFPFIPTQQIPSNLTQQIPSNLTQYANYP
ncbi:MAG TPA: hypothetical protein VEH06_15175 [Candidatus Bathyarchaeia archaeon]|nr:hypothetical protein [Candidatus Bathyarchaeia archaeon]